MVTNSYIREQQSKAGSFKSQVCMKDTVYEDYNGFVSALILRELIEQDTCLYEQSIDLARRYLAHYEAHNGFQGYRFWTLESWPRWAPELPADSDDTSVIALELAKSGYITIPELAGMIEASLLRCQIKTHTHFPVWVRKGAFRTWIDDRKPGNPVDCCVNINILALFAFANFKDITGYQEIIAMLYDAFEWSGESQEKFRSLALFYPDLKMFVYTIDNAIACGCSELEELKHLIQKKPFWPDMLDGNPIDICSNANRKYIWRSLLFDRLFRLRYENTATDQIHAVTRSQTVSQAI